MKTINIKKISKFTLLLLVIASFGYGADIADAAVGQVCGSGAGRIKWRENNGGQEYCELFNSAQYEQSEPVNSNTLEIAVDNWQAVWPANNSASDCSSGFVWAGYNGKSDMSYCKRFSTVEYTPGSTASVTVLQDWYAQWPANNSPSDCRSGYVWAGYNGVADISFCNAYTTISYEPGPTSVTIMDNWLAVWPANNSASDCPGGYAWMGYDGTADMSFCGRFITINVGLIEDPAYCTPDNRSTVPLNVAVPFDLDLENYPNIQRPVSWSATTGSPTTGGDLEQFDVSFSTTGKHGVTVSNSLGSETCYANVVSGSGYTLSVNSNGASSVGITSSTGHGGTTDYSVGVTSGTAVALTAPPTSGSASFSSWTGCDSVSGTGNRTCNLTMPSANKTVTVNYDGGEPPPPGGPYTLSVNSTGKTSGVVVTGVPSTYGGTTPYGRSEIPADTSITLSVDPTSGAYSFVEWTGCDSTSGVDNRICNLTMNANKTVSAAYIETPPGTPVGTISADPNPCILAPGETTCSTTLTRNVENAGTHQVRMQGSGEKHDCDLDGTWETNPSWIRQSGHTFVLVDTEGSGCTGTEQVLSVLDDILVWAEGRGTIEVVSNLPTSWTITGEGPTITGSGTSGTYTNQISGSWTINPESLSGYTFEVTPVPTQTLENGGSITFTITYTTEGGATLDVRPASKKVEIGQTQQFDAYYDPDGVGGVSEQLVTGSAQWASSDPSVATVDNTLNKGLATALDNGTAFIEAEYFGLSDAGLLEVGSGGGGGVLECVPAEQDSYVGTFTSIFALGGSGSYSWSAPGGTPETGSGSFFEVRYSSLGTKTVTLEDGTDTDQCTVNVISAVCGNNVCEPGGGESCSTCPTDCGECPVPECSDGIDNDGDGTCDTPGAECDDGSTPGDPQCTSPSDNSESIGGPTFEEF